MTGKIDRQSAFSGTSDVREGHEFDAAALEAPRAPRLRAGSPPEPALAGRVPAGPRMSGRRKKDPLAFRVFNEIGIIEQLARNRFERALPDAERNHKSWASLCQAVLASNEFRYID